MTYFSRFLFTAAYELTDPGRALGGWLQRFWRIYKAEAVVIARRDGTSSLTSVWARESTESWPWEASNSVVPSVRTERSCVAMIVTAAKNPIAIIASTEESRCSFGRSVTVVYFSRGSERPFASSWLFVRPTRQRLT